MMKTYRTRILYLLTACLLLYSCEAKMPTEEQFANTEAEIESSMYDDLTSPDSKQSRAEYLSNMILPVPSAPKDTVNVPIYTIPLEYSTNPLFFGLFEYVDHTEREYWLKFEDSDDLLFFIHNNSLTEIMKSDKRYLLEHPFNIASAYESPAVRIIDEGITITFIRPCRYIWSPEDINQWEGEIIITEAGVHALWNNISETGMHVRLEINSDEIYYRCINDIFNPEIQSVEDLYIFYNHESDWYYDEGTVKQSKDGWNFIPLYVETGETAFENGFLFNDLREQARADGITGLHDFLNVWLAEYLNLPYDWKNPNAHIDDTGICGWWYPRFYQWWGIME